jgi:dCMP deaminase
VAFVDRSSGDPSVRPSVDQYFMDMVQLVKVRGTCPRRQVGAVIVKDKRVLTTGYNGAPRNFPHPVDVGCLRDELQVPRGMIADICPCLHAEQNAIIQAATTGVSIEGAELYCTTQPCTQCSRMIANCGIQRVVFQDAYPDPLAIGILTTSGVKIHQWNDATKKAVAVREANTFEEAQDEIRRRWKAGEMGAAQAPGRAAAGGVAGKPAKRAPALHASPPETGADDGETPEAARVAVQGLRDLTTDPHREELIRQMAREKAERRRKALEDAGPKR